MEGTLADCWFVCVVPGRDGMEPVLDQSLTRLTLDEVGVAEVDAAEVIYDLRRAKKKLMEALGQVQLELRALRSEIEASGQPVTITVSINA